MSVSDEPDGQGAAAVFDLGREDIDRVFRAAAGIYIETRRARVPGFVQRHFSLRGALRIHRVAFGWDILRAPANVALALPHLLKLLIAGLLDSGRGPSGGGRGRGAARAAAALRRFPTQLRTDVEREIEWLVWTELLELPFVQGGRRSDRDALGEILLSQPEIARALAATGASVAAHRTVREQGGRMAENLSRYTGARNAAAEIAVALASATAGGVAVQQLTPTAYSLGPPLAALVAHNAAVAAFPLGSGIGGAWYALFPVQPSAALVAGVTGGLLVGSSVCAAFAGIVADPVQRLFGVHRRRLDRFIAALGADLGGAGDGRFAVRAHYVARLLDVVEAVRLAVRLSI